MTGAVLMVAAVLLISISPTPGWAFFVSGAMLVILVAVMGGTKR